MAIHSKRTEALEVAQIIIEAGNTDVESVECEVENWPDHDLYEWIESWRFVWNDGIGWAYTGDDAPAGAEGVRSDD